MVGLQSLDLPIGVRIPVSQPMQILDARCRMSVKTNAF